MIIFAVHMNLPPYIHEMVVAKETAKQWRLDSRYAAVDYIQVVPKAHPMVFALREDALYFARTCAAGRLRSAQDMAEAARILIEALK